MKSHEYKTLWEEVRARLPRHASEETFYATAMAGGAPAGNGLVLAEGIWKQLRRPYYQVYPAIIPALLNRRLDLPLLVLRHADQYRVARYTGSMRIPPTLLSPAAVRAIVEEFVTRDGTDNSPVEQRIENVMRDRIRAKASARARLHNR